MTALPSVLVGIATRNRAGELSRAIRSAQAQTYRPLRIAVTDDASSDATAELCAVFPEVTWQRFDTHRGLVAARNAMMLAANEDYYVSLDDDAWFVDGDEIATAIAFLETRRDVAALAFDILSPDRPQRAARQPAEPAAMFVGCGHVLRLSAVRAVGGYAEFPGLYGSEEKDLGLRLIEAGHAIVRMPGLHVWHDKSDQARDLLAQHRSGVCNDLVMIWRRAPSALLVPFLMWKLIRHLIFALRLRLMRPCLAGFGDFAVTVVKNGVRRAPLKLSTFSRYSALLAARPDAV